MRLINLIANKKYTNLLLMKNTLYIPIIIILLFTTQSCKEKNGLTLKNLKGKVKSIDVYNYNAISKFGEIQNGSLQYQETSYYNKNGDIENVKNYKSDGSLQYQETTSYNKESKIRDIKNYNSDGSLEFKIIYKYDDDGNVKEMQFYGSDGNLLGYNTIKTDKDGNIKEQKTYNIKGRFAGKNILIYNDFSKIIENKHYKHNGKLDVKTTYKYNDDGDVILENHYEYESKQNNIWRFKCIKFDNKDNWIRQVIYYNGIPKYAYTRDIEYY